MKTNSPEASVEREGFQATLVRFHQNVAARSSRQEGNPPGEQPGELKNSDLKASERLTGKSRYQFSYSAQPDMYRGRETRSKNTWKGTKNVAEIHGNQEPVDALSRDYGLLGSRIQDAHRLTKFIQN